MDLKNINCQNLQKDSLQHTNIDSGKLVTKVIYNYTLKVTNNLGHFLSYYRFKNGVRYMITITYFLSI